jgi:hypothetical protein
MTPAQRSKFYFPAWAAAAKAHGWATPKSVLTVQRQTGWASPELDKVYQQIWDVALGVANYDHRAVSPKDFRRACHVIAIGQAKSANDLTNDECDRVVALFGLLADPTDLRAMMAWMSPNESRRRRILYWINHNCVESYVVAVAREKFGTDNFAALHYEHLRQLHMTLKNRPASRKSAISNLKSAIPAAKDSSDPSDQSDIHPF